MGRQDSLEGDTDDVSQDDHGGSGQAGSDLLAHKVVEGGVGGDLGVLPSALHVDGCSNEASHFVLRIHFMSNARGSRMRRMHLARCSNGSGRGALDLGQACG